MGQRVSKRLFWHFLRELNGLFRQGKRLKTCPMEVEKTLPSSLLPSLELQYIGLSKASYYRYL